jgi:hypothetical protein
VVLTLIAIVGEKWEMVVKAAVKFHGPVMVRVGGKFLPNIVAKFHMAGKVVITFIEVMGVK